jgi:hypothetical protein
MSSSATYPSAPVTTAFIASGIVLPCHGQQGSHKQRRKTTTDAIAANQTKDGQRCRPQINGLCVLFVCPFLVYRQPIALLFACNSKAISEL